MSGRESASARTFAASGSPLIVISDEWRIACEITAAQSFQIRGSFGGVLTSLIQACEEDWDGSASLAYKKERRGLRVKAIFV